MNSIDVLLDGFSRVHDVVHHAVDGLPEDQLEARLDKDANSIAWLAWHLSRVQDDHLAEVAGLDQVWMAKGWKDRFGLPLSARSTGYGHSSREVAAVKATAEMLTGYYDEVHEQTTRYVKGLHEKDLDRIVDERWDPPVSLGVRLVSVIEDDLQHGGQAAFIRGVLLRRS
jgi:uncharacterized damage-inducible protein DinB